MVEFYHKEGDKKLSFRIQENEKLTDVLLAHCSTKRVNVDSIEYAIRGMEKMCISKRFQGATKQ